MNVDSFIYKLSQISQGQQRAVNYYHNPRFLYLNLHTFILIGYWPILRDIRNIPVKVCAMFTRGNHEAAVHCGPKCLFLRTVHGDMSLVSAH